ncbi:TadE family protein [Catenulispora pinisilvae]|uniref:TadE family protein n=1 Tax=Catenulispora pinisilvae TaxID=2705253 RepID=UPI0018921222|nr:TadE family protein [Catenulispora pinisilvae]
MADRMRIPCRRRGGPDDGSAVVETVVLTPILIVVLMAAVMAGRFESARLHVDTAASNAARAASLARSPAAAQAAGVAEARRSLVGAGVACPSPRVTVDTTGFRPGGVVKVSLTCRADIGDLAGMGLVPINTAITNSSEAPVDVYRQATSGSLR